MFDLIKNYFFVKRYPFMAATNRWTGKFLGYAFTEMDLIPDGWRKALGKRLCEDISKAFRERGIKKSEWASLITWEDIKEKWGMLCLYAAAPDYILDILDRYEHESICYCMHCGKPARYVTKGWISYLCPNCFADIGKEKGERLTMEHAPKTYRDGSDEFVYVCDYRKAWGIEDDTDGRED